MKNTFLSLIILLASTAAMAQCDSFSIDFNTSRAAPKLLICSPGATAFEQAGTYNYKDEPTDYRWTFGDGRHGSVLATPSHTYMGPGTYDVTLYMETKNGCKDSITKTDFIEVIGPATSFTLLSDSVCHGDSIFVKPTFIGAGGVTSIWQVGKDNGLVATKKSHLGVVGLSTESLSAGKHNITLRISAKVKDPITGVTKDCDDVYPNGLENEDDVSVYVHDMLPAIKIEGWTNDGGLYLDNANDYEWHHWILNGDTLKEDTIAPDTFKTLVLVAGNAHCEVSETLYHVGIEGRNSNVFKMRYDIKSSSLWLSHTEKEGFVVEVFDLNGALVLSKQINASNGQIDLSALSQGVFVVNAYTDSAVMTRKLMKQ